MRPAPSRTSSHPGETSVQGTRLNVSVEGTLGRLMFESRRHLDPAAIDMERGRSVARSRRESRVVCYFLT